MAELKLHGFWASPFSHKVIWALKLKGISYNYIEENFPSKSELLLKYNSIHKKVPSLVHGEKPIAESLVILEYIEETWPEHPLLPSDAYEKASARFWIQYGVGVGPIFHSLFASSGKEKEKAAKELLEMLKLLEEQGLREKKFFGGDAINMVDIAYVWLAHWFEAIQQVIGIKLLEPSTLPRLYSWVQNFKEVPIIKQNLPEPQKLLAYMKHLREKLVPDLNDGNN